MVCAYWVIWFGTENFDQNSLTWFASMWVCKHILWPHGYCNSSRSAKKQAEMKGILCLKGKTIGKMQT